MESMKGRDVEGRRRRIKVNLYQIKALNTLSNSAN